MAELELGDPLFLPASLAGGTAEILPALSREGAPGTAKVPKKKAKKKPSANNNNGGVGGGRSSKVQWTTPVPKKLRASAPAAKNPSSK